MPVRRIQEEPGTLRTPTGNSRGDFSCADDGAGSRVFLTGAGLTLSADGSLPVGEGG